MKHLYARIFDLQHAEGEYPYTYRTVMLSAVLDVQEGWAGVDYRDNIVPMYRGRSTHSETEGAIRALQNTARTFALGRITVEIVLGVDTISDRAYIEFEEWYTHAIATRSPRPLR